jgi:hypothetical protein
MYKVTRQKSQLNPRSRKYVLWGSQCFWILLDPRRICILQENLSKPFSITLGPWEGKIPSQAVRKLSLAFARFRTECPPGQVVPCQCRAKALIGNTQMTCHVSWESVVAVSVPAVELVSLGGVVPESLGYQNLPMQRSLM